jgi:hypothetical protein
MPDERIQLRDRLRHLGTEASVGLARQPNLGHDALGRHVFEERLSAVEPKQMGAQAHDDPRAALGDVASQLGPERPRPRGAKHVPRGPGLTRAVVRISWKRLSFAGQSG